MNFRLTNETVNGEMLAACIRYATPFYRLTQLNQTSRSTLDIPFDLSDLYYLNNMLPTFHLAYLKM
jgi:hypothetical protein